MSNKIDNDLESTPIVSNQHSLNFCLYYIKRLFIIFGGGKTNIYLFFCASHKEQPVQDIFDNIFKVDDDDDASCGGGDDDDDADDLIISKVLLCCRGIT